MQVGAKAGMGGSKRKKQATLFDVLNERPRGHQRAVDLSVLTDQCRAITGTLMKRRQHGSVLRLVRAQISPSDSRMRAGCLPALNTSLSGSEVPRRSGARLWTRHSTPFAMTCGYQLFAFLVHELVSMRCPASADLPPVDTLTSSLQCRQGRDRCTGALAVPRLRPLRECDCNARPHQAVESAHAHATHQAGSRLGGIPAGYAMCDLDSLSCVSQVCGVCRKEFSGEISVLGTYAHPKCCKQMSLCVNDLDVKKGMGPNLKHQDKVPTR